MRARMTAKGVGHLARWARPSRMMGAAIRAMSALIRCHGHILQRIGMAASHDEWDDESDTEGHIL
jgi:hypothetical protein